MSEYDSKFEELLHKGPLKGLTHHPPPVEYEVPARKARYGPDFQLKPNYLLEAKGRFRTMAEAYKYIWVRDSNPEITLEFVFENPDCPMPGARRRKDGTKFTHKEWAEKNGFKWRHYPNIRGSKRVRRRRSTEE
jgi:hypothetical protein